MRLRCLAAVLGLAAFVSACGVVDPSKNTIETFRGTLQIGASDAYPYTLNNNGEVEVTMTSVVPSPVNGLVGVALGVIQGGSCAPLSGYVASGVVNRKVQFGFLNKGAYCVVIFDPGVLTTPVAYTGTFSHP